MHPLDKLLALRIKEEVEPTSLDSERNTMINQLCREAGSAGECSKEYHGVQCERPAGHGGNCAAVIIF